MASRQPSRLHRARTVVAALLLLGLVAALPVAADLPANRRIGAETDPTAASLDIAQQTRADGSATRVVLGRNDVFADNLGGSAAAGADGALLLVDPAPAGLDQTVSDEIERLLGAPSGECGAAEVVLLGGEAALGAQLRTDVEALGYCVDRLSGDSRVETSVDVAATVIGEGGRGTLLIARDDNAADSAAAGAYAAATGTPIVVTASGALHPAVAALLDPANGAWDEVVLLGGTVALTEELEAEVVAAAGADTTVRRIAGASRDDTALKVAQELWGEAAGAAVAIVNGFSQTFWTYALPGGVAASTDNAPLLYVSTDTVPGTTSGYLSASQPTVTTIGPDTEVSDAAKTAAEELAGSEVPGAGLGEDLRVVELDVPANNDGDVPVTIEEGDASVLFMVKGGDPVGTVFIDKVVGPDGFELNRDAEIREGSASPDVAISLPQFPGQAFVPGDYTFSVFSETAIDRVVALVKSGDVTARQEIDINYYVVSDTEELDTPEEREVVAAAFAETGETILGGFNLHPGEHQFIEVSQEIRDEHASVELDDNEITRLCAALSSGQDDRALNFAFINNITEGGEVGGVDGLSSGLPGTVVLDGFGASCVILSTDGVEGGLGTVSPVAWHEAGHLMGLAHTTEAGGDLFDLLDDTPECPASMDTDEDGTVDDIECGELADNFMFWTGIFDTMTADQAFVLARNPLFQPRAS